MFHWSASLRKIVMIIANMSGLIYEHCISFSGLGLCYECRTITSIECRFADDASFLEKSGDAWIHHMINQDEPGLIVTAWRYFKSLANRLKGPS